MSATPDAARALWARVREAHALAPSLRAEGQVRVYGAGGAEAAHVRLVSAAGRRVRLERRAQAVAFHPDVALYGGPDGYFQWRDASGVQALGSDWEAFLARVTTAAPRAVELLQLLAGRPLAVGDPDGSRPEDLELLQGEPTTTLGWCSADGVTRWRAEVRSEDAALFALVSETVQDFDADRALEVRAQALGLDEGDVLRRARLGLVLEEERRTPRRDELRLEVIFGAPVDPDDFEFAPPIR